MKKKPITTILFIALILCLLLPTSAIASPDATRQAPAYIGQTATFDNTKVRASFRPQKSEVTLLEVVRGKDAQTMVTQWNQFNEIAEEGKEYLVVKFSIKLISTPDESARRYDKYDFSVYSAEGVEYNQYLAVASESPALSNTYPGGTTTGYVPFMIDKGDDPMIVFNQFDSKAIWFSPKPVPVEQPTGTTNITGKVYVFSNSLNLRARPNTAGEVVRVLKYGNALTVVDSTSSKVWWAVKTADGQLGYAASSYLGRSVNDVPVNGAVKVLSSQINIRDAANGKAAILSVLPKGTALTVLDNQSSKSWVKVQAGDGTIGWVGAVYVGGIIK